MLAIGRLLPVIGDSVLSSPQNLLLWPLWFRKLVKSWSCQMWRSFQVIHQCRLEMYIVNAISVLISLQLEFPIDGLVSTLRIYAIRATCCKRDFNHCSMRRWTDLRLPHLAIEAHIDLLGACVLVIKTTAHIWKSTLASIWFNAYTWRTL